MHFLQPSHRGGEEVSELKPCPFCGGKPWRANRRVFCHDCGVTMDDDMEDSAESKWNRRVEVKDEKPNR